MKPIQPLMNEHRLIERMIELLKKELTKINDNNEINEKFIDAAVDFFITYTDKTHHGKEEDILFRELGRKPISEEHKKVLEILLEEHVTARKMVKSLFEAKENFVNGNYETITEIKKYLNNLCDFYPKHIEKEDKHFFIPAMEYFSEQELESMLKEFWDFDREMIHKKYKEVIESFES